MTQSPSSHTNNDPIGNAPATALSSLEQMISSSLGLAVQNAVLAQQQGNILHQAVTTLGIEQLYAVTSSSSAVSDTFQKTIDQLKQVMELSKESQNAK
ncbi:RebB family R body protein [Aphanothece sacrum]|uniref:Antirepresssor protein RebB n=1 Tax=Aphanothece sacrum FPU1 TaxID=1920663 RepID=A0A401ILI4_APHSA|nr:RebB family R body protein [Aphanothece sacrum]GBF82096.1 antirepresssor protein RebB [Aphanothece sacrum FPU1]GBF85030.1 antirepresssor protein RebB [Aphanothece sacrum FPU3]